MVDDMWYICVYALAYITLSVLQQ